MGEHLKLKFSDTRLYGLRGKQLSEQEPVVTT